MHDARVHLRLRKYRLNRLRKSREPVDQGDQHILNAPCLQLRHHAVPELRPFGLLDPEPQDILAAAARDSQREIDGFVPHRAFVPDLHAERVENHEKITTG